MPRKKKEPEERVEHKGIRYTLKEDGKFNTGRPKKVLDKKQFEEMCKIQCTKTEICAVLGMSDKTLDERLHEEYEKSFSEVFKEFSAGGLMSLRQAQFKSALKGNVSMQKHLGINYLDQVEHNKKDIIEKVVYKTDASDLSQEELKKGLEEQADLLAAMENEMSDSDD